MKTLVALAVALTTASFALAQAPAPASGIARISKVEGLVTVTTNNQLTNASQGMPLTQGAQVLSTGSGTATVAFTNGCEVTLKPGQSLLIDEAACAAFLASGGGAASASVITPTIALLGAGSLAVLAARATGNAATPATPAIPATPGTPATPAIPAIPPGPVSGS